MPDRPENFYCTIFMPGTGLEAQQARLNVSHEDIAVILRETDGQLRAL